MRLLPVVSAFVLLPAAMTSVAHSQSFTIVDGQTVTSTQTMAGAYDVGVVRSGGTLRTSVSGTRAILVSGPYASVINYGLISTTAFASRAIVSSGEGTKIVNYGSVSTALGFSGAISVNGDNSTVENFGEITTRGQYGDAITAYGEGSTLVNRGTITTSGLYSSGMYAYGALSSVMNYGEISSSSEGAYLLIAEGEGSSIVNSGSVEGNAEYVVTVSARGDGIKVVNSGKISTRAANATGVEVIGSNVEIVNSGSLSLTGTDIYGVLAYSGSNTKLVNTCTISVNGTNAVGILAVGSGDTVVNAGKLSAQGANSRVIDFQGADSVLTLLPGSSIEGVISYTPGAAASGTLNIEGGVGTALTFTGAVPANVRASGMIVGVDQPNLKVVAADVSSARISSHEIDTLLDSVFSSLHNRAVGGAVSLGPLAYAETSSGPDAFTFLDEAQSLALPSAWLKVFGGANKFEMSADSQANSHMGGLMVGIEAPLTQLDRAGFFLGGATSSTSAGSAIVQQNSGFAGLYSAHQFDQFSLDMALVLGTTRYESARSVIDNTVLGGVTTANAEYGGFFISPELGLGRDFNVGGQTVEVRGALQYTNLYLDGYTETSPGGSLEIDPRRASQLTAKLSIATPFLIYADDDATTYFTPRLGVDGSTQFGDQVVSGSLVGAPIRFDAISGAALTLAAGAQIEHRVSDRWSLRGDLEGRGAPGKELGVQASLEFKLNF